MAIKAEQETYDIPTVMEFAVRIGTISSSSLSTNKTTSIDFEVVAT